MLSHEARIYIHGDAVAHSHSIDYTRLTQSLNNSLRSRTGFLSTVSQCLQRERAVAGRQFFEYTPSDGIARLDAITDYSQISDQGIEPIRTLSARPRLGDIYSEILRVIFASLRHTLLGLAD